MQFTAQKFGEKSKKEKKIEDKIPPKLTDFCTPDVHRALLYYINIFV